MDEKCTLSINNENVGKHKAILSIVKSLKHGRSISDITLACSFDALSMSRQREWSKSLVSLASEVCNLKGIEVATPFSNCDDLEHILPMDGMKLFLTVMENTSATIEDVFVLLHPEISRRPESFDAMKYLPTCCEGERISTVLSSILDIILLKLHINKALVMRT